MVSTSASRFFVIPIKTNTPTYTPHSQTINSITFLLYIFRGVTEYFSKECVVFLDLWRWAIEIEKMRPRKKLKRRDRDQKRVPEI